MDELVQLRDREPTMFAREYMNDPRDDLASFFPSELTQEAIDAGAELTMVPYYRRAPEELIVLGADLARSERIGADYTVAIVAAVDLRFGTRRVLTIRRERGLDFQAQINLFTDLAMTFHVDVGFIEQNGFQGWLVDELRKRPGGGVFFGHTTGRGRLSFAEDGIPILKLALHQGRWIMPSADPASRAMARIWQAELGAFGCRNGRVEGVGEHDDIVIASWHLELAVTQIERHRDPGPEFGYLEDIDPSFERVRIGKDF